MSQFDRDYQLVRDCFLLSLIPKPIMAIIMILALLFGIGMFGPMLAFDNFGFIRDLFYLIWHDLIGNFFYIISLPFRS